MFSQTLNCFCYQSEMFAFLGDWNSIVKKGAFLQPQQPQPHTHTHTRPAPPPHTHFWTCKCNRAQTWRPSLCQPETSAIQFCVWHFISCLFCLILYSSHLSRLTVNKFKSRNLVFNFLPPTLGVFPLLSPLSFLPPSHLTLSSRLLHLSPSLLPSAATFIGSFITFLPTDCLTASASLPLQVYVVTPPPRLTFLSSFCPIFNKTQFSVESRCQ